MRKTLLHGHFFGLSRNGPYVGLNSSLKVLHDKFQLFGGGGTGGFRLKSDIKDAKDAETKFKKRLFDPCK